MKAIIILFSLIAGMILIESCSDSLGLDDNVVKKIKDPDYNFEDFYPNTPVIDSWVIIDTYYSDIDGNPIPGGYLFSDTLKWMYDGLKWGKNYFSCAQIFIQYGSKPRALYAFAYENTCIYRESTIPNTNTSPGLGGWKDPYGTTFPAVPVNRWYQMADFSVESWASLDTFNYTSHELIPDVYFTGFRSFRGKRGDFRNLPIGGRAIPCLEVIEYYKFCGKVEMADKDTTIDYEWAVSTLYGKNGIGSVQMTYITPAYNFGYGNSGDTYVTSRVVRFGPGIIQ
jgi:hypothetical protein